MSEEMNLSENLPIHVGVIMDGNGRWAKERGLSRSAGHKEGAKVFKDITRYASKIGIKYLTIYAFSTENWNRPKAEVAALMLLFKDYLEEALRDFLDENIKVNFVGDVSKFPKSLIKLIEEVKEVSKNKTGMTLNLAMNYGGRAEITNAVKEIAMDIEGHNLSASQITDEIIESYLYTKNQPDIDLVIRPSGEMRLSNFMLWQSAYAEFVFFDILWPDFKSHDLDKAIEIFQGRKRRFGGI